MQGMSGRPSVERRFGVGTVTECTGVNTQQESERREVAAGMPEEEDRGWCKAVRHPAAGRRCW